MKDNTRSVNQPARKVPADRLLTACVVFLTLFGTVMICSANISNHNTVFQDVIAVLLKQLVYLAAGYLAYGLMIRRFHFDFVRRNIMTLFWVELGLLVATRAFRPAGGAYAWIRLFGFSVQPSEFAKIMIIMIIANFMCDLKTTRIAKPWDIVRFPVLTMVVYGLIIILLEHDFGSGFAFLAIGCIVFLIPGNKLLRRLQWTIVFLMLLLSAVVIYLMSDSFEAFLNSATFATFLQEHQGFAAVYEKFAYQVYRFISAGDPLWDRFGYSQELLNSLLGIARGNLTGVGLGGSIQKFGYLASADADYIFPVIVEELGLIGIAAVFIPYGIIFFLLIKYALLVNSERDKVILMGTASYLFVHLFLNIGGVTALIPLTGVPLLLVSRGGTALVSCLTLLGICQNIIRRWRLAEGKR